jgi:hypothetical protein
MRLHNGYRTMAEGGQLAQLHPASAQLQADEDGLLPEWLLYHEFVATSRPFLRQVGARRGGAAAAAAGLPGDPRLPGAAGPLPGPAAAALHAGRCRAGCLPAAALEPPPAAAQPTPPYHRHQVCMTEARWAEPLLPRLRDVDVTRLSRSRKAEAAAAAAAAAGGGGGEALVLPPPMSAAEAMELSGRVAAEAAASAAAEAARAAGERRAAEAAKAAAARGRFLARKQQLGAQGRR